MTLGSDLREGDVVLLERGDYTPVYVLILNIVRLSDYAITVVAPDKWYTLQTYNSYEVVVRV